MYCMLLQENDDSISSKFHLHLWIDNKKYFLSLALDEMSSQPLLSGKPM
jgi:hypothetical protein